MTGIDGAPWQAKFFSTLFSQLGLGGAQYLAYLQNGGAAVTLGIAMLQAIQGSVAAYGLGPWQAAGRALLNVGEAVRRSRDNIKPVPPNGDGPGGPT